MIRLLLLIFIVIFFIWLLANLFFSKKKALNKKLNFPKPSYFLMGLIVLLLIFLILPRLGFNPIILIQKIIPFLSILKGFIPL